MLFLIEDVASNVTSKARNYCNISPKIFMINVKPNYFAPFGKLFIVSAYTQICPNI